MTLLNIFSLNKYYLMKDIRIKFNFLIIILLKIVNEINQQEE